MTNNASHGKHAEHGAPTPDQQGKFSVNEDWLATLVGLSLVLLALLGALPKGIVH